ncbi:hypothetical protein AAFF_G00045600 [Aldrovandia affinis]|uniref:Uncharacterized protein n=1 Tax=Aldrovandia affinis TaxID=143900 RepID=A0AAD7S278_9TELE|nr:hypothetical protein AAFF_G00045600 [Aldrovandia affinis]
MTNGLDFKSARVEPNNFSSGASSSHSTKFICRGVRYPRKVIRKLDSRQNIMVEEALSEHCNLLDCALSETRQHKDARMNLTTAARYGAATADYPEELHLPERTGPPDPREDAGLWSTLQAWGNSVKRGCLGWAA